MAYIGKQPIVGNYQVLDALTATTTATYALTKNSVAVYPQTPANCIVSLNGVIQAPFDSYTISGSNIVFASALTTSDSIDFITVLGDVLNVGTVSDGTIGLNKLSATGTKDATTFLRGDNTFQTIGTNTPAFEVGLSTTQTSLANAVWTKVLYDAEVFDTNNCFSSNKFTPTVAGKYFVYAQASFYTGSNNDIREVQLSFYKNGSLYQPTSSSYRTNALASYPNYTFTEINPLVSTIIDMNGSSDFLEVYALAYITSTCSLFQQKTFFGGYKIIE